MSSIPEEFSDILDAFKNLNDHPFAFGSPIHFPLSSIHIEGVGDVAIPIEPAALEKIKSTIAAKAPYGKGSNTLHDLSVRDCWQVSATSITTPAVPEFFTNAISVLLKEAAAGLNIDVDAIGIKANLYKLLFYEVGGHFLKHRDTEKEDGMFATYLVEIPTVEGYEGGKLVVYHDGEEEEFEFSGNLSSDAMIQGTKSNVTSHHCLFYADCEHELQAITKGTRVVLAFDVLWKKEIGKMMIDKDNIAGRIAAYSQACQAIIHWKEDLLTGTLFTPKVLVIPLEHRYTQHNLSFTGLKGEDSMIAQLLLSLPDIDVYVVLHTKFVSGPAEDDDEDEYYLYSSRKRSRYTRSSVEKDHHEMLEVNDCYTDPSKWINYRNENITLNINIDYEDCVVGTKEMDDLFGETPDEEEYEGYSGNAGATVEYWYHQATLVVLLQQEKLRLLLEGNHEQVMEVLKNEVKKCQDYVLIHVTADTPPLPSITEIAPKHISDFPELIALFAEFPHNSNIVTPSTPEEAMQLYKQTLFLAQEVTKAFMKFSPSEMIQLIQVFVRLRQVPTALELLSKDFTSFISSEHVNLMLELLHELGWEYLPLQCYLLEVLFDQIPNRKHHEINYYLTFLQKILGENIYPDAMHVLFDHLLCQLLTKRSAANTTSIANTTANIAAQSYPALSNIRRTELLSCICLLMEYIVKYHDSHELLRHRIAWYLQHLTEYIKLTKNNTSPPPSSSFYYIYGPSQSSTSFLQDLLNHADMMQVCSKHPCTKAFLMDLLNEQIQTLEAKLPAAIDTLTSPTNWSFPKASIPGYPQITEFLRSNLQSKVFSGFGGLRDARGFLSIYGGNCTQYSVIGSVNGKGKNVTVAITKTWNYFDRINAQSAKVRKEIEGYQEMKKRLEEQQTTYSTATANAVAEPAANSSSFSANIPSISPILHQPILISVDDAEEDANKEISV